MVALTVPGASREADVGQRGGMTRQLASGRFAGRTPEAVSVNGLAQTVGGNRLCFQGLSAAFW
jgi:hypothetical protein